MHQINELANTKPHPNVADLISDSSCPGVQPAWFSDQEIQSNILQQPRIHFNLKKKSSQLNSHTFQFCSPFNEDTTKPDQTGREVPTDARHRRLGSVLGFHEGCHRAVLSREASEQTKKRMRGSWALPSSIIPHLFCFGMLWQSLDLKKGRKTWDV